MNYISKEELAARLESDRNGCNHPAMNVNVEHRPYFNGGNRAKREAKILPIMKPVVGALAWTDGVNKTAKAFGVTRQRVYELKNARSCFGVNDNDLKEKISDIRRDVSKSALDMTLTLMGLIDAEKDMNGKSPKDIIALAKDTSVIYKNVSDVSDSPKDNVAKVIIIAPSPKDPEKYEMIDV